jgi:hypothetical protein
VQGALAQARMTAKTASNRARRSMSNLGDAPNAASKLRKHCVWICRVNTALGNTVFGIDAKHCILKHSGCLNALTPAYSPKSDRSGCVRLKVL